MSSIIKDTRVTVEEAATGLLLTAVLGSGDKKLYHKIKGEFYRNKRKKLIHKKRIEKKITLSVNGLGISAERIEIDVPSSEDFGYLALRAAKLREKYCKSNVNEKSGNLSLLLFHIALAVEVVLLGAAFVLVAKYK